MSTLLFAALLPLACQDTKVGIYNTAPSATITDPVDGATFAPEELIELRGIVQDGQEAPEELAIVWTSSVDGELGSSEADSDGVVFLPVTELSGGLHAITLTAVDGEGKIGEETITIDVGFGSDAEGEPTLIVLGPTEGDAYTFSQTVTVVATVSDDEQPWDTLNATILSSRDGTLWTGLPASNGAISDRDLGRDCSDLTRPVVWTPTIEQNRGKARRGDPCRQGDRREEAAVISCWHVDTVLSCPRLAHSPARGQPAAGAVA